MPHYVEWDGAHPDERVTRVRRSEDAARYQGSGVVMSDAELRALREQEPPRYWRYDAGAIRVMDAGEKAAAVAEDDAAREAAQASEEKRQADRRVFRALIAVLLPEINWAREQQGKQQVTVAQVVEAIKARIDAR